MWLRRSPAGRTEVRRHRRQQRQPDAKPPRRPGPSPGHRSCWPSAGPGQGERPARAEIPRRKHRTPTSTYAGSTWPTSVPSARFAARIAADGTPPARPGQQRRSHGSPGTLRDSRRLRTAVRNELPRPVPAHDPAGAPPAGHPRSPRRHHVERAQRTSDGSTWTTSTGERRPYSPARAYAQSKLADLLLGRHLAVIRPGARVGPAQHDRPPRLHGGPISRPPDATWRGRATISFPPVRRTILPSQQSVETGAEPLLFAATSPDAEQGAYYGPSRLALVGPHPPGRRFRIRPAPLSSRRSCGAGPRPWWARACQ